MAEIQGTVGADILNGTADADQIFGNDGNDTLNGLAGNDALLGQNGDDVLNGGDGNDLITGGLGADTITGGAGVDRYTFGFGGPRADGSPSAADVITDFEGAGVNGGDLIELPSLWNMVFHITARPFSVDAPNLLIPEEDAENFQIDVYWQVNTAQNRVEIWVDTNDNGLWNEADLVIYLNGVTSLIVSDFVDNFYNWEGTDGNDTYFGNALANIADGLLGNDTLNGGDGNDTLLGQQGDDILNGDTGRDFLLGGDGNDTLNGGDDADDLRGEAGNDVVNGGFGNDNILGGDGDDILSGGADDDRIEEVYNAGGGNNELFGNDGNDVLRIDYATAGAINLLDGGDGDDTISVSDDMASFATLLGGAGNDTLTGLFVTCSMDGGAGNDVLNLAGSGFSTNYGVQTATGGTGADRFVVSASSNGDEVDRITDFNVADGDVLVLSGVANGRQNGTFPIANVALLFRGAMDPALFVQGAALPGSDIGTGFAQYWTVQSGGNTYLVGDTDGDLVFDTTDFVLRFDGIVTIDVSSFVANTFLAQAGTPGADTLTGTAGNDTLIGGLGVDTLYGGAGADLFLYASLLDAPVGSVLDTIADFEVGVDKVDLTPLGITAFTITNSGGYYILDAETASGAMRIRITANGVFSASDVLGLPPPPGPINGTNGPNSLTGTIGDDVINGLGGNDTLSGIDGNDVLNGDGGADTLIGGTGDDALDGGASNDTLLGGAGNDIYYVNLTTDVVTETAGNGIDTAFSTASAFTLSVNVENITLLGAAAINATANTLANVVTGNNGANNLAGLGGNDTIIGGAGNDRLIGGAGADVLIGGTGNDTYQIVDLLDTITELVGEGIDLVQSSVNHTLGANLEKLYLSGSALIGIGNELGNTIIGTSGANTLNGMAGADFIYGGNGNDVIIGGAGRDQLFGEAGADVFALDDGDFGGVTSGTADLLRDFSLVDGDIIDLSAVDAITGGADDGFTFIGNAAFSNVAGQLRFQTSATSTTVMGDLNGDGVADFWIVLTGLHTLDGSDFLL